MAPPVKLAAERAIKAGRFSYPPDLQEKVDAYRRARKLSALIQDAIRAAPWPPGWCSECGTSGTEKNPVTWGPDPYAEEIAGDDTPVWECQKCRHESADEI